MPSEVQDPKVLYIYLSLSAGSSSVDTGLRVLERILKANKIPFSLIDIGTDERAKSIWSRRKGQKHKLPALVRDGQVIGDFTEIEEWNEYGELKQRLGLETPPAFSLPQTATTTTVDKKPEDKQAVPSGSIAIAAEAAAAAAAKKNDQK